MIFLFQESSWEKKSEKESSEEFNELISQVDRFLGLFNSSFYIFCVSLLLISINEKYGIDFFSSSSPLFRGIKANSPNSRHSKKTSDKVFSSSVVYICIITAKQQHKTWKTWHEEWREIKICTTIFKYIQFDG